MQLSGGVLELTPEVSWDAWRSLLGRSWTEAERQGPAWFAANAIRAAARAASADAHAPADTGFVFPGWDSYVPPVQGTPEQETAYQIAATIFHEQHWRQAVAAFDAVASQPTPYRAAAAYSAARATLDAGNFDEGIQRLASLLADPDGWEMRQATHHLLGTLAWATDAPPLLAARLAEISHLLMAPTELRCRDIELNQLVHEADDDLEHIIRFAFATNRWDYGNWSEPRRDVFAAVATLDPVIDLVRILAEPTPFGSKGLWVEPFYPDFVQVPGFPLSDQPILANYGAERQAAANYARSEAAADSNPLWAFALARLTSDVSDLPLIRAAIGKALSGQDLADDRNALAGWLAAHEIRILLMAGHVDEALQAMTMRKPLLEPDQSSWAAAAARKFVVEGGEKFLLAGRDLAAARRWAVATWRGGVREPYRLSLKTGLDLAIATTWQETFAVAVDRDVVRDAPSTMPESVAATLDLLPADRLVELARTPGLAASWKRPVLSAAWIRYYILRRDHEFTALFPEIRAALPELAADLADIDRTWTPWTRRRSITRMLLRFPGLSPRVLWSREIGDRGRYGSLRDLFRIDAFDPNDGNWWCPLDPARVRRDAFAQMFGDLSQDWGADKMSFNSVRMTGDLPSTAPSIDSLSELWLRLHPLTRDADGAELAALAKGQSGPARLTAEAMAWAKDSNLLSRWLGFDRDLPETLALAVRATRYGCRMAERLGPASHAAWQSLHSLYPHSEWAQRTRWWFDENGPAAR